MTKAFTINKRKIVFWYEGKTLFCKIGHPYGEVYCCGVRALPQTREEAIKLLETAAWAW